MLLLQVLLQIQSDQTQAPGIYLHQIGGDCWPKWCSSIEESKPFEGCWRLGCACCCWAVLVRIWGSLSFVIHSRLNPKHRHSQSFKRKSVFQTKWKTTDCFVETTDCFILRCFEKRLKTVFQMVKLLKQNNRLIRGNNRLFVLVP